MSLNRLTNFLKKLSNEYQNFKKNHIYKSERQDSNNNRFEDISLKSVANIALSVADCWRHELKQRLRITVDMNGLYCVCCSVEIV